MFKNYFIIAIRNFTRYKLFTLINVLGLAIGFACSILILLFILHELSYDQFHENAHRIYRIVRETQDDAGQSLLVRGHLVLWLLRLRLNSLKWKKHYACGFLKILG